MFERYITINIAQKTIQLPALLVKVRSLKSRRHTRNVLKAKVEKILEKEDYDILWKLIWTENIGNAQICTLPLTFILMSVNNIQNTNAGWDGGKANSLVLPSGAIHMCRVVFSTCREYSIFRVLMHVKGLRCQQVTCIIFTFRVILPLIVFSLKREKL